jgi:hypothetical protein
VELYLYSPSGTLVACYRVTFTLEWPGHGVNQLPPCGIKVKENYRANCTSKLPLCPHEILQVELYLSDFYPCAYVFAEGKQQVAKNCDTPSVLINDHMYVMF